MKPLVSVIIPTYKRSEMLLKAIDSVLEQDYLNVEVIVVDDNDPSSDYRKCTEERMSSFIGDSRVIYLKHPRNMNGATARNTGLKICSGEYVCFLDDDDFFYKNKCKKQISFLEANLEYSACCCDYKKNGKFIRIPPKSDYTEDILLLNRTPQTSGIMFRKKSVENIGGFNESYVRHQDYELLLRFFHSGNRIYKMNDILYERNVSEVENTPKGDSFLDVKKKFLLDFDNIISQINARKKNFKRKVYCVNYERVAKNYLKGRSLGSGLLFLFKSFYLNPLLCVKLFFEDFVHGLSLIKGA